MRIRRTLPPAAAPLHFRDLWSGFKGFFTGDRYLGRLEDGIREYFGTRHVWLASSGKAALYLILRSLRSLRPGRPEVLIPAYTCFSVPSAIVRAGLKVALCDIDASSLDFDGALLKKSINANTLCVMPNHLFGIPSGMEGIMDLCRERGVFVLEDAAQAMGGMRDGKMLGTIGDVGFFSLGRGKPVTCGSGGIIVTNSDVMARAIEEEFLRLSSPGKGEDLREYIKAVIMSLFVHPSLYWIPSVLPFLKLGRTFFDNQFPVTRLSPVKAGLGLDWEKRLERSMRVRRQRASALCRSLGVTGWAEGASPVPYLRLPVIVGSRDLKKSICTAAGKKGLGITGMYPSAINEVPEIAGQFSGRQFPGARLVAERLITVPVHEFVSERDQEEMVRLLSAGQCAAMVCPTPPVPGFSTEGKAC